MTDFPYKGSWLVNYDPKEFKYPDVLILLAKIQDYFEEKFVKFNLININFNKNGVKNYFFYENGGIFLSFCDFNAEFAEKSTKPCEPSLFKSLEHPVKTVSLLFPSMESDPRWKTIGLAAGQMVLASNLLSNGFEATPKTFVLKGQNQPPEALKSDLTGFSLFEDLLPLLRPILADFRLSYRGIMAAGGPFSTLAPLAAIFHLPQIDLFVRGEAEFALPKVLKALNSGDADEFFSMSGVFWRQPGLIAMAGFDQVNRPEDLARVDIDLGFLKPRHMEHGLEMNFSRGCGRGCMFCCHAQGTKLRKLPVRKAEELLAAYKNKIENPIEAFKFPRLQNGKVDGRGEPLDRPIDQGEHRASQRGAPTLIKPGLSCNSVNINDDDILQDPEYAGKIFDLVKKLGFRIFGIQTSTASLIKNGAPNLNVLDLVADPGLYVDDSPLLWLGTDAFLPRRATRLGKKLPPGEKFNGLLTELEKRGLRHFHYWISSDGDSTWEEFVEELILIFGYLRGYPGFGLLAHAPFVVPYPSSRLFERLAPGDSRLKLKLELTAPDPRFSYRVVDRLETRFPQLNNLLKNEKAGGEKGFFDLLKERDLMAAAQLAYHFLRQEQLLGAAMDQGLGQARERLEKVLETL